MTIKSSSQANKEALVFDLKADVFTLPVIIPAIADLDIFAAQLAQKVTQAPGFFKDAPVVIDLSKIATKDTEFNLARFLEILCYHNLIPIGIRGETNHYLDIANHLKLPVLQGSGNDKVAKPTRPPIKPPASNPIPEPTPVPAKTSEQPAARAVTTLVMRQPVRSGQRIYAEEGDLVIVGSVSSGAELLAQGNIHVYGTIRGRVLAGVNGDTNTHIFCLGLAKAEIISIAGKYCVPDGDISSSGKPTQIFIKNNKITIEEL